jgi:hypothetical protein
MGTALVPLLVLVVGVLLYFLSPNGKLAELGRMAAFVGLLWLVYLFAGRVVHF